MIHGSLCYDFGALIRHFTEPTNQRAPFSRWFIHLEKIIERKERERKVIMNPDSANVELETVKQNDEQEYVDDEVTQESGTLFL